MSVQRRAGSDAGSDGSPGRLLSGALTDRSFDAIVFDWDGTAVTDRAADARDIRRRVEALCDAAVDVVVVSGTHVGNIDGQLAARPRGPGRLWLCLNRGSEVFAVDEQGPHLLQRRDATAAEDRALDRAAARAVSRLAALGVESQLVSERLNRRKIDLIPLPAWRDPPKAEIIELVRAVESRLRAAGLGGLKAAVDLAEDAARDEGLAGARVSSDAKHVEIGLTDKSDSLEWVRDRLWRDGVGPGLVLIAGDEFGPLGGVPGSDSRMLLASLERATVVSVGAEPGGVPDGVIQLGGGPARFLEVLDAQLERRQRRCPPAVDEDPTWTVRLSDGPQLERVRESLTALANGRCGTRGAREEDGDTSRPLFLVGGVYTDGSHPHLLAGPRWTSLPVASTGEAGNTWLLDLRTGVLAREHDDRSLRTFRFASAATPSVLALRAEGNAAILGSPVAGGSPDAAAEDDAAAEEQTSAVVGSGSGGGICMARCTWTSRTATRRTVERLAAWQGDLEALPDQAAVVEELGRARHLGFGRLLMSHRREWATRWEHTAVSIEGDERSQLAVRFALFHLLSSVDGSDEAAVGARGLTGPGYGGHVFWDAEVFVLPALACLRPSAARAMLEYRVRRLGAARAAATAAGFRGARFPWESAGDGRDVTPREGHGPGGRFVPILTGKQEEHITADIAWAALAYAEWTGDAAFLAGPGRELVVEAARYFESRFALDGDGSAHLRNVLGPDEYHVSVDDNCYTNVMARWNLRRAAELLAGEPGGAAEAARFVDLAARIADGYVPATNRHEQFRGYDDLEPLVARDVATPPFAADLLLGRRRTAGSQLIKQADVLMAHRLVPDELPAGSLEADFEFYEPRTVHGSSLSPAVHATLLARLGRPDEALELFELASRLDFDDLTRTTSDGLHLASLGSLWQALSFGFLGMRRTAAGLLVEPHLPSRWSAVEVNCWLRGAPVTVRADHSTVSITCSEPAVIVRPSGGTITIEPPGAELPPDKEA